jgi:cytochrome c oxidase subunit 4
MQAHKHVSPIGTYIVVWTVLMVLLLATVLAADIHLDDDLFNGANISLAMLIAIVKALIVMLWFMHVKDASKLTWVFAAASFLWLAMLIVGTLQEYHTRGFMPGWETPVSESYTPAHLAVDDIESTVKVPAGGEKQNYGPTEPFRHRP